MTRTARIVHANGSRPLRRVSSFLWQSSCDHVLGTSSSIIILHADRTIPCIVSLGTMSIVLIDFLLVVSDPRCRMSRHIEQSCLMAILTFCFTMRAWSMPLGIRNVLAQFLTKCLGFSFTITLATFRLVFSFASSAAFAGRCCLLCPPSCICFLFFLQLGCGSCLFFPQDCGSGCLGLRGSGSTSDGRMMTVLAIGIIAFASITELVTR